MSNKTYDIQAVCANCGQQQDVNIPKGKEFFGYSKTKYQSSHYETDEVVKNMLGNNMHKPKELECFNCELPYLVKVAQK